MGKPWTNAIKFGLLSTMIVSFLLKIIFQTADFSIGWIPVLLPALFAGLLTGLFAYDRARIQDLEYRLEYLEEKLDKLMKTDSGR